MEQQQEQEQKLSLEQMIHLHRYKVQRETKSKKTILLEKQYRLFTYIQEPRNKYEISLHMGLNYGKLVKLLPHYERLGIVQITEYNPNKYKLTPKGLLALHKIKELNSMMDRYTKKNL